MWEKQKAKKNICGLGSNPGLLVCELCIWETKTLASVMDVWVAKPIRWKEHYPGTELSHTASILLASQIQVLFLQVHTSQASALQL